MVTVNSGQLPTARGVEEGYDLAIVIGKWQAISSGRFRNDCRDLLQMIDETDELRLWEKNVGGFTYSSRDEFLKRKVLIDYDLTETALHDIVGKLKGGEDADLSRYARNEVIHSLRESGMTQQAIADEVGDISRETVRDVLAGKRSKTEKPPKKKRTSNNARTLYLSKDPEKAADVLINKLDNEFCKQLGEILCTKTTA